MEFSDYLALPPVSCDLPRSRTPSATSLSHSEALLSQCLTFMSPAESRFTLACFCGAPGLQDKIRTFNEVTHADAYKSVSSRSKQSLEMLPTVKNPVHCLNLYDTVAWRVDGMVYPVFLKDSLLSRNNAIDISTFMRLQTTMQSHRDAGDATSASNLEVNLKSTIVTVL